MRTGWGIGSPTDGTLTVTGHISDLSVIRRAMETLGLTLVSIPNTVWAVSRTVQTDNLVSISSVDVHSVGEGVLSDWTSVVVDFVSWGGTGIS